MLLFIVKDSLAGKPDPLTAMDARAIPLPRITT